MKRRFLTFAYVMKRRPMMKVIVLIFTVMFLGALLILLLEGPTNEKFNNIGQTMWWAVVTMTTVGYGDKVPLTDTGRLVGGLVMFSGVAVISLFTAAISSILVTRRLREAKGLQQITSKNHLLICGWYPKVEEILFRLRDFAVEHDRTLVLINDLQEEEIEQFLVQYRDLDLRFVRGDFTDESVLNRANVRDAYAAIIVPDTLGKDDKKTDERTILATLAIKAMQPKVKVFAHIQESQSESHLRRANADRIIISDQHSGFLMASHVQSPGIPELIDGLFLGSLGMKLSRIDVPHNYVGKTFSDFAHHVRGERSAILLGFVVEEEGVTLDDILSSDYSSIDDFIKQKLRESGKGLGQRAKVQVKLNPPDSYTIGERDIGVIIESAAFLT